MPRLLSVNVGLPRDIAWRGEAEIVDLEAGAPVLLDLWVENRRFALPNAADSC